jgi:hypothetical protein
MHRGAQSYTKAQGDIVKAPTLTNVQTPTEAVCNLQSVYHLTSII